MARVRSRLVNRVSPNSSAMAALSSSYVNWWNMVACMLVASWLPSHSYKDSSSTFSIGTVKAPYSSLSKGSKVRLA